MNSWVSLPFSSSHAQLSRINIRIWKFLDVYLMDSQWFLQSINRISPTGLNTNSHNQLLNYFWLSHAKQSGTDLLSKSVNKGKEQCILLCTYTFKIFMFLHEIYLLSLCHVLLNCEEYSFFWSLLALVLIWPLLLLYFDYFLSSLVFSTLLHLI